MLFRSLSEIYEELVKYEIDAGPGGPAQNKGPTTYPINGANNIGTQQLELDPGCGLCEGGNLSNAANHIPLINATAGLHDVFQVNISNAFLRTWVLNVPGMGIAFGMTAGGFFGIPLTYVTPQQIIFMATSPGFRASGRN